MVRVSFQFCGVHDDRMPSKLLLYSRGGSESRNEPCIWTPQILTATEVLALYARYGSIPAYNRIDWGYTWRDISGGSGIVEK